MNTKPWKRFFARFFDFFVIYSTVGILILIVITALFKGKFIYNEEHFWVHHFIFCLLSAIPIETFLIWKFGSTPGKFIYGLRVQSSDNKPPKFTAALKRTLWVNIRGQALYTPLSIFTLVYQFTLIHNSTGCSWENDGAKVIYIKNQWIKNIIGFIFILIASVFFTLQLEVLSALAS